MGPIPLRKIENAYPGDNGEKSENLVSLGGELTWAWIAPWFGHALVCSCSRMTCCISTTRRCRGKGVLEHIGLATATSRGWRSMWWDWETHSKLTWTVSDRWPPNLGSQLLNPDIGTAVLSLGGASTFQKGSPPPQDLCVSGWCVKYWRVTWGEGSRRYCCGNDMTMQTLHCIPVPLFTAVTLLL